MKRERSEELDQKDCTGLKRGVLMIILTAFFVEVIVY